jgi:aspartyl-tRNA(Asn)/glutamyl-tRNA(Gln) amidotransferase subunit C
MTPTPATTLTLAEVEHIADLARLELSAAERQRYRDQLAAILDYAARLGEVDTTDVPPTASILPRTEVLRPDVVRPSLDPAILLRGAPDQEAGQFRTPPILE